jgi:hypothetical protein
MAKRETDVNDCKCGSGLLQEEVRVQEFGYVVCCRECRKGMVQSIRDATGDRPEAGAALKSGSNIKAHDAT